MTSNREWLVARHAPGPLEPEKSFKLNVAEIPKAKDGEIVIRITEYSLDPTQKGWISGNRGYRDPVPIDAPMEGFAVGVVTESKAADYAVGDHVSGLLKWQEYVAVDVKSSGFNRITKVPKDVPSSLFLGLAGLTGLTAYFGLLKIGDPKPGETVFVTGAAGATGSVVVQIAKIKGARVVGTASDDEKCAWLKSLGCDATVSYRGKSQSELVAAIKEACPKGIDVIFENVGGDIFEAGLSQMNPFGRIVACGSISTYSDVDPAPGPKSLLGLFIVRRLKMQGFLAYDFLPEFPSAVQELLTWYKEGKLQNRETVLEGFEQLPTALSYLFSSKNTGKLIVRSTL